MEPIIDVAIVEGEIAAGDAAPRTVIPSCGGEAIFIGRTRGERHAQLGELRALRYEAYAEMAVATMTAIAREAAARFGCGFVGVRHSVGRVAIGEAAVLVRVLAGHRAAAFDACREVIDRIKSEAPIWKQEEWAGGATWREDEVIGPADATRRSGA